MHLLIFWDARKTVVTLPDYAPLISDKALSSVIDEMDCNLQQTWTVSDLYKLYQEYDGQLSSKHMISNLSLYYGEELMILRLEGCANVIGFRRFMPRSMKLVAERDIYLFIYYVIFTQEYPISAQHCSPWGSCITCMTKQTSISIHSVIIQ